MRRVHRRVRRTGGEVAGEQVIGGVNAGAVLRRPADVEGRADDLQSVTLPPNAGSGPVALQNGFQLRAVPDREEVGVGVAAGVRERAADVDLPGVVGDCVDIAVDVGPTALQALPFHLAIWSAAAWPPALRKSPPTYSVPGLSAFNA